MTEETAINMIGETGDELSTTVSENIGANEKSKHKASKQLKKTPSPRNIFSFIKRPHLHLTKSVDKSYFSGKAGHMRLMTLFTALVSLCIGFPGFSPTETLENGYGGEIYILVSMCLMVVCILLSVTFIFLLLLFREVRCQAKWDDWNLKAHAFGALLAALSGILELCGTYHTRLVNCPECRKHTLSRVDYHNGLEHKKEPMHLDYKEFHYASCLGKLLTAILFSFCSRMFLKNTDQLI